MRGEVLDKRRRGLDDVCVKPENPGRAGSEGGENKAIPRAGHGLAADLLVLELMPLLFVLRHHGRIEVLAEDGDAREASRHGARLGLADGLFERGGRGVALFCVRDDEAEGDQLVRIAESLDVVPVALVEAGEGGEDEDALALARCVAAGCEVVEIVFDDRRRRMAAVIADWLRDEGFRGRGERVFCGVFESGVRRLGGGCDGRRRRGEDEADESERQQGSEDDADRARSPHVARDGHLAV